MSGNRTVGDVLLEMECDNRRLLRSLIEIEMEASKITGNPTSTNCPNCGAPITGPFCDYCGTIFDISETKKILAPKENERNYKKAMDAMLEYTPEEVDRINAIMRITNIVASEMRGFRGI